MNGKSISAIVLFSGENSIGKAIESVLFCNEVIVIHDCASGEKNCIKIPRTIAHLRIFHKTLVSFSEQRNFGLKKVKSEWVLFLDADEVVTNSLAEKIHKRMSEAKEDAFVIRRVDNFLGRTISKGELLNIYLLRLAKKNAGKWSGVVHEEWKVKGRIGKIKEPIMHFPHPTIREFISQIDRYTTLRSQELQHAGVRAGFVFVVGYPLAKFVVNYFFKLGFLDGNRGFVLSMMMSMHSFLVRSKLYQAAHKSK